MLSNTEAATGSDGSVDAERVAKFQKLLNASKNVVVLTGAGVSAESGIPIFGGEGGVWRSYDATELANPQAFAADPSLVWEFYSYQRQLVAAAKPNAAHLALANFERRCERKGREFHLITQNVDGLHLTAGSSSSRVIEMHGSLWRTRCSYCHLVVENWDVPICAALEGRGSPHPSSSSASIPVRDLPRCSSCRRVLRPHVVWFGESLDEAVLTRIEDALADCDLLLIAGTSGLVDPAAGYAWTVRARGGTVAEINTEATPISKIAKFKFRGKAGETLPILLGCHASN